MMTQKIDIIPDDMSITRGLLGRPDIPPRRRTSFTSSARSAHTGNISNELEESTNIKEDGGRRRMIQSSNTWTTSSGEILSEQDDIEDRIFFILEYNRLATKHGVRTLSPEDSGSSNIDSGNALKHSGSWFSRKILRRMSSSQSVNHKNDRLTKRRRSISDLSLRLKSKNNTLKDKDLQELVRLCGLSLLYLPTEYAASSLAVPTCFRATAQYLIQHASTVRGVFRVPGSHNIVAALYNHYCTMDEHGAVVSGTVRCPTLPEHIRCDVHDVASAFKKFISGLPGGILGSLSLFDAFISIQSQLNGAPELTRTKQSKVRARLIALAIATLRSQYRRELICAVFGLLSMIGRTAEVAPRENDRGQPLPTSDLMGYGPLGIVFGPLLVGDLLENYTMLIPNPRGGLVLLPISPPKSRKERNKKNKTSEDCSAFNAHVDKIKVANSITEMLITHWRDVVRHMKNMKALKIVRTYKSLEAAAPKQPFLRPSASESFALRKPPDWDNETSPMRQVERCESPTPACRGGGILESRLSGPLSPKSNEILTVRKQRSRPRPMSSQMLSGTRSMSILSPTTEENPAECSLSSGGPSAQEPTSTPPPEPYKESPPLLDNPGAAAPKTSEVPQISSPKQLRKNESQSDMSYKNIYPFSDNPKSANRQTFHGPENVLTKRTDDGSSPVQEHKPIDCPPPIELKDCAPTIKPVQQTLSVREHELKDCPPPTDLKVFAPTTTTKYLLKQTRLFGPRVPQSSAPRPSYPDITLCRVPSLGQPKPTAVSASRRISASEPGLLPDVPNARSIRHSKSTFSETDRLDTAGHWRTPKDPLARVSVAEDLASLAALAQVLEEEPAEARVGPGTPGKVDAKRFDELARQNIKCRLPKLIRELEETEAGRALAKKESDFGKLAREVTDEYARGTLAKAKYDTLIQCMGELAHEEVSLNAKDSRPVQKSLERPRSIHGPNYSHLSGRRQSPKNNSLGQYFDISESPTIVKQQSPAAVSAQSVSVEFQVENSQKSMNDSPRLSVRALAAKFNNEESVSILTSSTTKSLSKATSIDIRAYSDSPEKIVAPYKTNLPSPTKSQKSSISNVSFHSVRIPPSADRAVPNVSPPRKSLRSDLKDSTPLRSVPKRESLLLPPDSPACCSPAGSPQRLSLFDGPSVQPSPCPMSPHVHFDPKEASVVIDTAIATNESPSITMAINPLTSPPPTRSNSLLHAQIRNIQQQLSSKTEEVRHLKRQLGSRANLDIGALSEELREAKKEIQVWKNRTEVAEKQLQVMATLSARNSSHNTTSSSSMAVGYSTSTPSRANYSEDGAVVAHRIRRALHGMDGASSLPGSSECSTDTVVRDVRREDSATESEYSMWVDEAVERL